MSKVVRLKLCLWALLLSPLALLGYRIWLDLQSPGLGLGADPGEAVMHFLGEWSLIMLLCAFSVTPLRQMFVGWQWSRPTLGLLFSRSRRLVGLFAFFYVTLHLLAYVAFFLEFSLQELWLDFVERAYITAGIAAFVALALMAITSTRGWQRRLQHRWQLLHKLIYAAITLGIIHLWWLTRDDYGDVVWFSLWFLVLLALRLRPITAR